MRDIYCMGLYPDFMALVHLYPDWILPGSWKSLANRAYRCDKAHQITWATLWSSVLSWTLKFREKVSCTFSLTVTGSCSKSTMFVLSAFWHLVTVHKESRCPIYFSCKGENFYSFCKSLPLILWQLNFKFLLSWTATYTWGSTKQIKKIAWETLTCCPMGYVYGCF